MVACWGALCPQSGQLPAKAPAVRRLKQCRFCGSGCGVLLIAVRRGARPDPCNPCCAQEGAHHERCEAVVLSAMKHQAECGAPQLQCTFNGAWGGPRVPKVFYVSSYFWDRATDAGGSAT